MFPYFSGMATSLPLAVGVWIDGMRLDSRYA